MHPTTIKRESEGMCDQCAKLLSEGLDLCVRARKLDAQDRANASISASRHGGVWESSGLFRQYAKRHNEEWPYKEIAPKSATIPIWVADQSERDLAAWEQKARHHLMQGCAAKV
jgi:hypothetical protein